MSNSPLKQFNTHQPTYYTVDDFYADPQAVRELALQTRKIADLRYWKGKRSAPLSAEDIAPLKQRFEEILGTEFKKEFRSHFHLQTAEDPLVFHADHTKWAAAIYLTPNAPPEAGTCLIKSKRTGMRRYPTEDEAAKLGKTVGDIISDSFNNMVLDRTAWEDVDRMGNVYNRLVIWQGILPHAVAGTFGYNDETGRLVQLFFFE